MDRMVGDLEATDFFTINWKPSFDTRMTDSWSGDGEDIVDDVGCALKKGKW